MPRPPAAGTAGPCPLTRTSRGFGFCSDSAGPLLPQDFQGSSAPIEIAISGTELAPLIAVTGSKSQSVEIVCRLSHRDTPRSLTGNSISWRAGTLEGRSRGGGKSEAILKVILRHDPAEADTIIAAIVDIHDQQEGAHSRSFGSKQEDRFGPPLCQWPFPFEPTVATELLERRHEFK
jgi:hypothetical protein